MTIACVTSDPVQSEFFERSAASLGHQIELYSNGKQFMDRRSPSVAPDLFILSWALCDNPGSEVLRWIRKAGETRETPVIVVGHTSASHEVVAAFSEGADDFIVFPIDQEELLARVTARLRRSMVRINDECLTYGAYRIDMVARVVMHHEMPVTLTSREFDVLEILLRNLGRNVKREHIARSVWGREFEALSRTVDTHVSRVRSKLKLCGSSGVKLAAVYGHGYRLDLIRTAEA